MCCRNNDYRVYMTYTLAKRKLSNASRAAVVTVGGAVLKASVLLGSNFRGGLETIVNTNRTVVASLL